MSIKRKITLTEDEMWSVAHGCDVVKDNIAYHLYCNWKHGANIICYPLINGYDGWYDYARVNENSDSISIEEVYGCPEVFEWATLSPIQI